MTFRPARPSLRAPALGAVGLAALLALLAVAGAAGPATAASADTAATAQRGPLRLQVLNIRDPLNRQNAARMLVPVGWRTTGGVAWDLRYHTLASAVMQVRSPNGLEALETYPLIPHTWDTQGIFGFPTGSNYLGAIVVQPQSAIGYLERFVIPTFRGRANARVVQRTRLPRVSSALNRQARKLGIVTSSTFDAARVRITYSLGGRAVEEDFYTAIAYTTTPLLPTRVTWQSYYLYSFRAARGKLDRAAGLLQAMNASVRLNLRWYAGYLQVQKLWIDGQMQAIRAAGGLSRAIARASDEIRESTRKSYERRDEAYDRISEAFSERIRGVETYRNPFEGSDVQLPSDYSYAWASPRGDYVLSNEAGFNPNVGSTIEWRLLRTS